MLEKSTYLAFICKVIGNALIWFLMEVTAIQKVRSISPQVSGEETDIRSCFAGEGLGRQALNSRLCAQTGS